MTNTRQLIQIHTTLPDRETAHNLLISLLKNHLVACGHICGARSSFHWNGAVQSNDEYLLSLKTREDLFDAVQQHIVSRHPYELPMITATVITHANMDYVDWVVRETSPS